MFKNPFSFEGRIRRTEFGLSMIIVYAYAFIIALTLPEGFNFFLLIPAYWFGFAQGAKRCHDRGNSGWFQIIPVYVLWMLFADSDNGINEYGHNPKGISDPQTDQTDLQTGQIDLRYSVKEKTKNWWNWN